MPDRERVVVTGMAGLIGTVLRHHLSERWELVGLDLVAGEGKDIVCADITDSKALVEAFRGAHAVIHLAASTKPSATWDEVLHVNIDGTKNVFEVARETGTRKVVFASSNHVTGHYELDSPYAEVVSGCYEGLDPQAIIKITHRHPIRPDGFYGVSKAFGEAAGRYYSEAFGMEVHCLRIGTVTKEDRPQNARQFATLLTHRDVAALVEACLATKGVPFEIFYGVSNNRWRFWDIEHARETLSWVPQDNAEDFRDEKTF